MKLNKIFVAGLMASMAFVACNKETAQVNGDTALKSVSINLANVLPGVRSTGSEPVADGSKVTINNFQIFFSDGTNLYTGKAVDGTTEKENYFEVTNGEIAADEATTYHYLDAAVNKVIVVGNMGQLNPANEAALNELLAIAGQQDVEALSLYGESGLVKSTSDEHGSNFYEAQVSLLPRVSRFEIVDFVYNLAEGQEARNYASLTIEQVAFNNYYAESHLAKDGLDDLKNTTITKENVFSYLEGLEAGWYTDKDLAIALDENAEWKGGSDKQLAYNFFPAGEVPQIVVKLVADKGTESELPTYLATSGFNGFETGLDKVGKVYRVSFEFEDGNLEQPVKCVKVIVSASDWVVVPVTPIF